MRALREDPRLIRYIVLVVVGMPVMLALSTFFPDRLGDDLLPFVVAFSATFAVVYLLALGVEALFRRRWSGDR